jgi:uncharacterized protein (TIGR03086 family)
VTTVVDLGPAARQMAELVANVPDGVLDAPTPCPDYRLGDLLEHVGTMAVAFTAAATKETEGIGRRRPTGDAANLADDWRERIPRDLARLAEAWRAPLAWTGRTLVGGADLPGEMAGVVALDELVLHGWDVARATGQPFDVEPASLRVVHGLVADFATPERAEQRAGLFGPVVEVGDDEPLLHRVLGLSGRDPHWSPS